MMAIFPSRAVTATGRIVDLVHIKNENRIGGKDLLAEFTKGARAFDLSGTSKKRSQ